MTSDEVKAIWERYLQGKASDREKNLVEAWYNQMMDRQSPLPEEIDWEIIENRLSQRFYADLPITRVETASTVGNKTRLFRRIAAVAAVLLFSLGSVIYVQWQRPRPIPLELVNTLIVPGGNKATLHLADGSVIPLSEEQDGVVIKEGTAFYADGSILLDRPPVGKRKESVQNLVLSTPVGGQYHITLSDGTKVWLNASSSLTYPGSFEQQDERVVELIGEAYFEVAHDTQKPFKVKSRGQMIGVLGTVFNVNAYDDEPFVKTTLLSGKVAVTLPSGETKHLARNQESLVKEEDPNIAVRNVNGSDAIDWKNGDFVFDNESLESIMRKISRWYDVDVVFRGTIPVVKFGGAISRKKNITDVLQLLELTGDVHFKFEETKNTEKGRRIIVMP